MRESCEGELCLSGLIGRHTLVIGCGCQGNHVVQGVRTPPIIKGWVHMIVTPYSSNEGKAKFSGLPGGTVGGGGVTEYYNGKELN